MPPKNLGSSGSETPIASLIDCQGLLIAFAVCTVLLIAVHMLAVMISTCILPHVEAVSNLHLQTSNTVFESPHRKMSKIIELAWAFSTVLGILLFLGIYSVADLGCLSRNRIFSILDHGSASKNLSILTPKSGF
jgi:hypothetical protein